MIRSEVLYHDAREERGFDVFISHSSRRDPDDHELVDALTKALRRRSLTVFVDRLCLERGVQILPSLEKSMKRTSVGLIVLTQKALASGWVALELEVMKRQRAAGLIRILALRLDPNCPVPHGIVLKDVIEPPYRYDLTDIANRVAHAIRTI